jgi:PAS domain S-box-containing protein
MAEQLLVIDDEESIRFTFEALLKREGYAVRTADGFPAALEVLEQYRPDLIFVDIVLGPHRGTEILKVVQERGMKCPVVIITGKPTIESAAESVRLGAFDYLTKPIGKEILIKTARLALGQRRLLQEKEQAERERERTRHYLETVFRSIEDAIITVDQEMRIVEANGSVERICGVHPGTIQGRKAHEIFHYCQAACLNILKECLDKRRPIREYRMECTYRKKAGQVVVINSAPLVDQAGQNLGGVFIIRDITRLSRMEKELAERYHFHNIIGRHWRMQELFCLLEILAETETTVLITGETGTGKEMAARAIHYSGSRAAKPLVSVNCAALAENLLESELFGHVKGAFTGAIKDKVGRFQAADGGTLFLDEIGELPPALQVKLLRVLQEKEIERVGDSRPIPVNVRIIAATNADLKEKIARGAFREDLYYRIKVMEISLPPLRERTEDIPLLVDHFCAELNSRYGKEIPGISREVLERFLAYPWPGNVRELRHALERAFVVCPDTLIGLSALPLEIRSHHPRSDPPAETGAALNEARIQEALVQAGGNKAKAARLLGISRQTLYRRMGGV